MVTRKKSMSTILNSIAPLVLIILAGLAAGVTGILPATFRTPLSDFCYYFGMPALLIRTIATAPPGSTAAHLIWISYLLPAAAIWILASLFARQDRSNSGSEAPAIAMASAYGNVIMLGIPLALAQFGPKAATTVAFVVLVHSPVLFLLAALHSELADGRRASRLHEAALLEPTGTMSPYRGRAVGASFVRATRDVSIDLATNPIMIAILIGLALRTSGLGLDPISSAALSLLAQATLPCVLLAMGLGLSTFALKGKMAMIAHHQFPQACGNAVHRFPGRGPSLSPAFHRCRDHHFAVSHAHGCERLRLREAFGKSGGIGFRSRCAIDDGVDRYDRDGDGHARESGVSIRTHRCERSSRDGGRHHE